jgi:hypothetical protein
MCCNFQLVQNRFPWTPDENLAVLLFALQNRSLIGFSLIIKKNCDVWSFLVAAWSAHKENVMDFKNYKNFSFPFLSCYGYCLWI